ncbi:hypothetical protein [Nocardia sp. NPDC057227]|uniref:hypothetical protein n=1 Tax=Nocardia sp. NPDC057227 TaxID=3346056 RepID=UPI003628427F
MRREFEPTWQLGTFCLDDRRIVENDRFWVFTIGAWEWIVEVDLDYAIPGPGVVVYKTDGRIGWVHTVDLASDDTIRSRPNPNPTLLEHGAGEVSETPGRTTPTQARTASRSRCSQP